MARILFVEDEEAVLKRLLKYFEREGFEVRGAQTGTEALEAAASFHPDVAVLDVMLHEGPARWKRWTATRSVVRSAKMVLSGR